MKLMHGKLSPFVRKVMVAAAEKGLTGDIELVPTRVAQGVVNAELLTLNPTGKIPTLITDSGESVYDSLVIVDYLDQLRPSPRLIPLDGTERRRALTLNAAADGLIIAGVLAKGEAARPEERRWPEWITAQWAKVQACLAALEAGLPPQGDALTVGEIAAGCALGWLDVRAPEEAWRGRHPGLAAWFDAFAARPSMQSTKPSL
ncbi:glutathione S-transferase family protein [Roseomonas sp. OT10]|uniref:glutathione S-transferase family protein n=1 Tax=Roseomonas cutis TaxID=2897332 RepID=UPI001E2925AF|nr:glutathione S-transferase family protein [Roseomonas sp. OT10]UFN47673.1 glutathione S-transferase family protein [Roseomonas sp. OT10]